MKISGIYSFNKGEKFIKAKYPSLLEEIKEVVKQTKAEKHLTKKSREKTMTGKMLYSPKSLNVAFKKEFAKYSWTKHRENCEYSHKFYTMEYTPRKMKGKPFREMDFIKEKLGVEVQFGKYSFMVYNVCAKMTIFKNLGHINAGVEIVPIKQFADNMSTGVSYFEQFIWDLDKRGVSNIDIPVLILGIDTD
ncbi:MAG: restriction endonuclease [Deltaproteobacteria bacterium]|nr:restriction endonuclease [Deltaproteobacteria bacterium]